MALKLTNQNFDTEVLKADVPVVVDFYADWCGPCKMMAPVVESLAAEYGGRVKVAKINIDEEQDLAIKYGVMSIPTFIVFKDGKAADKKIGAVDKRELTAAIDKVL